MKANIGGNSFISWYKANRETSEEWFGLPVKYLELMLKIHMIPVVAKNNADSSITLVVSYGEKFHTITIPAEVNNLDLRGQYMLEAIYGILEEDGLDMNANIDDPLNYLSDDIEESEKLQRHQIALLVLHNAQLSVELELKSNDIYNGFDIDIHDYVGDDDCTYDMLANIEPQDNELADFISRTMKDSSALNYPAGYSDNTTVNHYEYKDPNKNTAGWDSSKYNNKIDPAVIRDFTPSYEDLVNTCEMYKNLNSELRKCNDEYRKCLLNNERTMRSIYDIINEYLSSNNISDIKDFVNKDTNLALKDPGVKNENLSVAKPAPLSISFDTSMLPREVKSGEIVIFTYAVIGAPNNIVQMMGIGHIHISINNTITVIPSYNINPNIIITGIYFMMDDIKRALKLDE